MSKIFFRFVVLALMSASSVGCVAAKRYETARSQLDTERTAHRRTGETLFVVQQDLDGAKRALDERERRLAARESEIAQARFDSDRADQDREVESGLVTQLRGELARAGDHLRSYAEEKRQLDEALTAAEERARQLSAEERDAERRALVMRDLSLLLHERVATGEIELAAPNGRPELRMPSARVLEGADAIHPLGAQALTVVARALALRPGLTVSITEQGGGVPPESRTARLRRVADVLYTHGVDASRVALAVSEGGDGAGEPSFVLTFAVPAE